MKPYGLVVIIYLSNMLLELHIQKVIVQGQPFISSMSGKREYEDTLLVMMSARRSQKMPQKVTRLQCKLEDTIALS